MERTMDVNAVVERARGIVSGAPVYEDGFAIGSVRDVRATDVTGQSVTLTLRISRYALVNRGDRCILVEPDGPRKAYLEFLPRRDMANADWELLHGGETIHAELRAPAN
jgi:hypothetical protein